MTRRVRALAIVVSTLVFTASVHAQTGAAAASRPRTPIGPDALAASAVAVTLMSVGLGFFFGHEGSGAGGWRGGILLDDGAREGLRLTAPSAREAAAITSDVLLGSTVVLAGVVDAMVVPLVQDDLALAWQAATAYAFALGLTLIVQELVKGTVGRERPLAAECEPGSERRGCGDDAFKSFFSGHAATSFASAGFSCAMHLSRSLYGDAAADGTSCAVSLLLASTTGILRIAADQHYLSDVVVGAVFGFAVGYLVPLALVPERRPASSGAGEATEEGPGGVVLPTLSFAPDGGVGTLGIAGLGWF